MCGCTAMFSTSFSKGDDFSDFLVMPLDNQILSEECLLLTLKAPIMTAADDIHKYFFIIFQRK